MIIMNKQRYCAFLQFLSGPAVGYVGHYSTLVSRLCSYVRGSQSVKHARNTPGSLYTLQVLFLLLFKEPALISHLNPKDLF